MKFIHLTAPAFFRRIGSGPSARNFLWPPFIILDIFSKRARDGHSSSKSRLPGPDGVRLRNFQLEKYSRGMGTWTLKSATPDTSCPGCCWIA